MPEDSCVIGVDFGTDSVRSVLVNARDGREISTATYYYPRWKKGLFCNSSINQFRQHPLDYIEGLTYTINQCLKIAGKNIAPKVKAISVDTTGSSPVAVNKHGIPLALLPDFAENPNAMFILWKDHTSVKEAKEINEHAKKFDTNYLKYTGGIYSSEWYWAKLLHVLRKDKNVAKKIYSFVEHCDWIPYLLTGETDVDKMKRSVCAAGHKGLWAEEFGGFPPEIFFSSLDPKLKNFIKHIYKIKVFTSDKPAGIISKEWAKKLGVPQNTIIGIGAFDAHMGAVGAQITPYHLSKVMGTSTCDMLVVPPKDLGNRCVKGICGQVPGSIIPGMIGLEAGQSAFGDSYAWFKNFLLWPIKNFLLKEKTHKTTLKSFENKIGENIIKELSLAAAKEELSENSELALDWLNGRRTPDANQELKAVIEGINLGSTAPKIFRALAEATCFGAKAIVERFKEEGIPIKGLIGIGGVAQKSQFIMQMMADVMNMPIKIHKSEQTCATGAAMFAAVAAGLYPNTDKAMKAMGAGFAKKYHPDKKRVPVYQKRFLRYKELGAFISGETGSNK